MKEDILYGAYQLWPHTKKIKRERLISTEAHVAKGHVKLQREGDQLQAKETSFQRKNPSNNWVSDFYSPCWRNVNSCGLSHPGCSFCHSSHHTLRLTLLLHEPSLQPRRKGARRRQQMEESFTSPRPGEITNQSIAGHRIPGAYSNASCIVFRYWSKTR